MESPAGKLGHTASATELVLSRLAEDRQRLIDLFLAQRARLHQTLGQIEDWLADIAGQFHAVELSIRRRHFELAVRSQELERRERIVAELTHKLYCRLKDWELLQDRLRLEQEALSGQLRDAESTLARAVSQLEDQFHNWNRVKTDLASRIDQAWNVAQRLGQEEGRLASWEHELALRENALADREKLLAFREARTESQRRLLVHRLRTQRHARKAQNPGGEIALDSAAWQDFLRRWEAFVAEQQRVRALLEQLAQAGLGSWAGSNSGVGVEASPEGLSDRFSEQPDSGSSGRDVVCPRKLEGVPTSDSRPPEVVDLDPKSPTTEGEHGLRDRSLPCAVDESLPGTKPNAGTLPADGATLSWEEQKRLLLSALEGQQAAGESARATWEQERIALQQALTEAQRQLAERDREILTLQKLLEEQSTHLGSLALGAAAIEELVAHDEIIQQERENARRLREEWEEKLRQAEVELSLERAKIARERAELEERARQLAELAQELQKRAQQTSVVDQAAQGSERSFRRKWFQQLGRGSAPSEKK